MRNFCEIHQNIREDVYYTALVILQTTISWLLIVIDACKRASAALRVMPYYAMLDKIENPPLEHQFPQS